MAAHFTAFGQYLPFLTSMFLHGGFLHIIMNMWFLYIFGITSKTGWVTFDISFFISSVVWPPAVNPSFHEIGISNIPTIGASGAISGVMGRLSSPLSPFKNSDTGIHLFLHSILSKFPPLSFSESGSFCNCFPRVSRRAMWGGVAFWAHIGGFCRGSQFLSRYLIGFQELVLNRGHPAIHRAAEDPPDSTSYPSLRTGMNWIFTE